MSKKRSKCKTAKRRLSSRGEKYAAKIYILVGILKILNLILKVINETVALFRAF